MLDYSNEPVRSPLFTVNAKTPFNAEPPAKLLRENLLTPNEVFLVRNHAPVPSFSEESYFFTIDGAVSEPSKFVLKDIYKLPTRAVQMTLSCAGNRRTEMSAVKPVKGVGWGHGALSTAIWEGPLLRDILLQVGVTEDFNLHLEMEGWDSPPEEKKGVGYTVSIPLSKAIDNYGDVILAYKMNGKTLPPDHGYPIRVVVPGYIGARSVKWLKRISVIPYESKGFFQDRDYKLFTPQVDWDNVEQYWDISAPIAGLSVQSAICDPSNGQSISPGSSYKVKGYALSDGRKIIRVDVSLDGGMTWQVARILPSEEKGAINRYWAWAFWELIVPAMPSPCTIVCRAWDSSSNTQPETIAGIWNLRGVLNNSHHIISIRAAAKV